MNNTIQNAKNVLDQYTALNDDKYFRFNEGSHHQVNVKRYNDDINIDEILKDKKYQPFINELKTHFNNEFINSLWYNWLESSGYILMEDIKEFKDYKYLENFCFRGRSGGYVTFDDDMQGRAEELDTWLDDISTDIIDFEEYKNEIIESTKDVQEAINEVENAKKFIDDYNKSLNFKDEVIYKLDEELEELQEEQNKLQNDDEYLKTDINSLMSQAAKRLNEFKANPVLKNSINRNIKSIKKILE